MSAITYKGKPLGFVKYEKIKDKNPKFEGQTIMLDGDRYITIWYIESEDKYYACIG